MTVRHVLDVLDQSAVLWADNGTYFKADHAGLAVLYERDFNRPEAWSRNALRREILGCAAEAYAAGKREIDYIEGGDVFIDVPWVDAYAASQILAYEGFLKVDPRLGHNFSISITPTGYEVARDEARLRERLPLSATDDDEAHTVLARDALKDVISTVEELLKRRKWDDARRELGEGDRQYDAGHWADAVGEYYSALESGLKHRLIESNTAYGSKAALRELAKEAAIANLFPRNYQELFSFADSIRSPRRHGSAGVQPVPIGKAEALLMGNLIRSLLLYLGHRGP